ncbi:MAG: hypothetical protein K1X57_20580, partial [Gemmataceae bacterium]|nr:hypothetical protein [Gemmataceae bacterium]
GTNLLVRNSTIANNLASDGGAIRLFLTNNPLTIQNSTIFGNTASGNGGGINRFSGSGTISLESVVLSGNVDTSGGTSPDVENNGKALSYKNSAIGTLTGTSSPVNDLGGNLPIGAALKLGSLATSGSANPTLLPAWDSPVVNAGSNPAGLTTDQRGGSFSRAFSGGVDIGAVEAVRFVVVNNNNSGAGSLRQAVADAGTLPGIDVIGFDTTGFSSSTITLTSGEITLSDGVVITGPGAGQLAISGNNASRVFNVNAAVSVVISSLSIVAGTSTGSGGGLVNSLAGTITLDRVTLANNKATGNGGGIANLSTGSITIQDSWLFGNSSGAGGGGVNVENGSATIVRSTLSGNSAANGGGLRAAGAATVSLVNSTLSANSATGASATGGGVRFQSTATLTIRNCTLVQNSAGSQGGGVSRSSGTVNIESSILAQNTAVTSGADFAGPISQGYYCLIGSNDGTVITFAKFNMVGTKASPINAKLGALANNGGPTPTHLPASDSPAREAGSNPGGLTTDQRGSARVWNGRVDIGATEANPDFVVRNDFDSGPGSLRQQILDANSLPGPQTITFDALAFAATDGTITLTTGEIAITEGIAIVGPGAKSATISGGGVSRILNASTAVAASSITLSGLTFAGGSAAGQGGAILLGDARVTIDDCAFTGNTASDSGGAINMRVSPTATLAINRSSFTNNRAAGGSGGGALAVYSDATISIRDSLFAFNTSATDGGGLWIFGTPGSYSLRNSTLFGNSASTRGGAIWQQAGQGSSGTVTNSTLTGNVAGNAGGGVYLAGSFGSNSTITFESTVVSGNTASKEADIGQNFTYSLAQLTNCAYDSVDFWTLLGGGNLKLPGSSLLLGSLADNGGPTLTMLPAPTSPLINRGSNPGGLANDQRGAGYPRSLDTATDIGAVELPTNSIISTSLLDPATNNLATVRWQLTFSQPVASLTASHLQLVGAGATGATITGVAGGGTTWTVTAGTGADGALGLTIISDPNPALPISNPTSVPGYTIDRTMPQLVSITRLDSDPTNAASVSWVVAFSEQVGGISLSNFSLSFTGLGGSPTITGISGTGSTRTISASTGTGQGTLRLDLANPTGIVDGVGNALITGSLAGEAYSIDKVAPVPVLSTNPGSANEGAVGFSSFEILATFNEPMNPSVLPTISFPVENPGISLPFISAGWKNANTYRFVYDLFDINLEQPNIDVRVSGGADLAGNSHVATDATDLFTIDTKAPTVTSVIRANANPTNAASVAWTVTFSEPMSSAAAAAFLVVPTGLGAPPAVTGVVGSGTTWTVTSGTGDGAGTLSLYVIGGAGLTDMAGNTTAMLPVIGPAYTIDRTVPQVTQITPSVATVTDAQTGPAGLLLTVEFNEPMNTAIAPMVAFPVENPGTTLAATSGFWVDAKTYRATHAVADNNIALSKIDVSVSGGQDAIGNTQAPSAVADVFGIEMQNPLVSSISRSGSNPTSSGSVQWLVTFSEPVTGVDAGNFALSVVGLGGSPTITSVTGSGATRTVTASTGSGTGTLGLDFVSTSPPVLDSVGNPLAFVPFVGEVFSVLLAPITATIATNLSSIGDAQVGPATLTLSATLTM